MEPNKDPSSEHEPQLGQQAPADALSRTPEDLDQEASQLAANEKTSSSTALEEKKVSPIKRFLHAVNVYFLLFILISVIAGAYFAITYLNSQKPVVESNVETQQLTSDALKQLSNSNASVGSASQTLKIQGNADIQGNTLMRGSLNVAGNFQTGGGIQGSSITVSGKANLGDTQVDTLQVAKDTAIEGSTTIRDLSVSGVTSLSGAVTASQLTVSKLTLSGNAQLRIPNHISFTGPSPSRTIDTSALGSGGSASVNGSDTSGTINVSTGNNPKTGCFARITFNQPYTNQPHVIVSPVSSAAGKTDYYVDRDKTGFSICSANDAPSNKSFAFDYFVTN